MSDADRIANLEQLVRQLRGDVAELRDAVQRLTGASMQPSSHAGDSVARAREWLDAARAESPPAPAPGGTPAATPGAAPDGPAHAAPRAPRPQRPPLDLESLIGRYGTIALATLTIVVGAGAFLTWAIANGKLGPHVRLIIDAVAAGAVAALGFRLRARGAPRFGNVLLGLALALAHVEAWGAGPSLHIVSSGVALAIAALASVALAALALSLDEQSLFVVGLGGALIAPFVVSEGRGDLFVLLGYGLVVLGLGLYVMRPRVWRFASWLMLLGCVAYTAVGIDAAVTLAGWRPAFAPAIFALCCAWCAVLWGGARQRRTFALGYLAIALLAHVVAMEPTNSPMVVALGIPIIATVTAYGIARLPNMRVQARVAAAVVLPLALFGAALLVMLRQTNGPHGTTLAVVWTLMACVAAWDAEDAVRPLHIMVAGLSGGAAVLFALHGRPLPLVIALAAHAVVFALLYRRWPNAAVLVPVALSLAVAVVGGHSQLLARPAYAYTPFLTAASAAALAVTVACWLVWLQMRAAARSRETRDEVHRGSNVPWIDSSAATLHAPAAALAAVVTFLWGRAELVHAYSPDIAIFLLVFYFAAVGVVAIRIGRRLALPLARFTGLALAIFAALKAVLRAWSYGAIGLKVGSCALAGVFLLAVAYWYREPYLAHSLPPSSAGGADGSGQRAQQAAQDAG